jgi:repressor LexA
VTSDRIPLTDRQREIYEFIRARIQTEGRKGYIHRTPLLSRAIELTEEMTPVNVESIPIVGRVAAGLPLLAVENIDGHVAVDRSFLPRGEVFSLRVTGDSMRDEGIKDGDLVLVKKQDAANRGDIVVAVIGEEATVKKFYPERSRVRLEPANEAFGPIIVDRNAPGFFIAGIVVGLLRRL